MKKRNLYKIIGVIGAILLCSWNTLIAQDSTIEEKAEKVSLVYLQYHVVNNEIPYVRVQTKNKTGRKFETAKDVWVNIFLANDSSGNGLIAKVKTNHNGEASTGIPPALSAQWASSTNPTIRAKSESNPNFDEVETEVTVIRTRLEMDTLTSDNTKNITLKLLKEDQGVWVPVPDVEMKIAVKRLVGDLVVGDEETYTTDSTGHIEAEFTRDSLPGDDKGNIILVAMVDNNEEIGSLSLQKIVPWGVVNNPVNNFSKRSLWSTGNKAPLWLMFMAYSLIISVWAVIVYLVIGIIRIRKLGLKKEEKKVKAPLAE